jgi:outer membrane biosynthesis protein TonB
MAENKSFASAFFPGLVVGLIVGSLLGAFVAPRLAAPKTPAAPPVVRSGEVPKEREPLPAGTDTAAPTDPVDEGAPKPDAPKPEEPKPEGQPPEPKPGDPKPAEPAPVETPK